MNSTRLYINNVLIPVKDEVSIDINKQINDIQRPDTRQADYTLPFEIPASKEIDILFSFIFDLNTDINNTGPGNFNPNFDSNKKAPLQILSDTSQQFDGVVQLTEIITKDNYERSYKLVGLGKFASWFIAMGEKELTDLDLSEYNHIYDKDNIRDSWATQIYQGGATVPFALGNGYVYPMVDFGHSNDLTFFAVEAFRPWIYVDTYRKKIAAATGFTINSAFLDSTLFKSVIISPTSSGLKITGPEITSRKYYAEYSADDVLPAATTLSHSEVMVFDNDSVAPGFDNSGQYNNATGEFVVGAGLGGKQSFTVKIPVKLDINVSGGGYTGQDVKAKNVVFMQINVKKYDAATGTTSTVYMTNGRVVFPDLFANTFTTPVPGSSYISGGNFDGAAFNSTAAHNIYFSVSDVPLADNDKIFVQIGYILQSASLYYSIPGTGAFEGVFDPLTNITYPATYTPTVLAGAAIFNNVSDATIIEGMEMDINGSIPLKIKQKDFMMSIIKMFNLYVQPDPDNDTNLFIEPRDDYYTDQVENFDKHLDDLTELVKKPMGALEASVYRFRYKEDKDYYNQKYITEFKEPYGTRTWVVDNDFNKTTKDVDVIFSPTPLVGNNNFDRVIPRIVNFGEDGTPSPVESNIRILFYAGMKPTSAVWAISHDHGTSAEFFDQYPFAGHVDDPYNPTVDLCFGMPRRIYWDNRWQPIFYRNNGLFNTYWYRSIIEITDKNSAIVTGSFRLRSLELLKIDFRKLYWFDNSYFRLNKINAKPDPRVLAKCEFLKTLRANPFNITTRPIDDSVGTMEDEPVPIFGNPRPNNNVKDPLDGNVIIGRDNTVSGAGVVVVGERNFIGAGAENVTVFSDDVVIGGTVRNVMVINSPGIEINRSDVTVINGRYVESAESVVLLKTGTYALPDAVTIEGDAGGGNVTVNLPLAADIAGRINYFKLVNVAGGNKLTINASAGETIDGSGSYQVTVLNDGVTLQSDGTNFIILK